LLHAQIELIPGEAGMGNRFDAPPPSSDSSAYRTNTFSKEKVLDKSMNPEDDHKVASRLVSAPRSLGRDSGVVMTDYPILTLELN
jgi:hypothetical protein